MARLAHDRVKFIAEVSASRAVFRMYDGTRWTQSDSTIVRRLIDELSELYDIRADQAIQAAKKAKGDEAIEYEEEAKRLRKAARRLLSTSGRNAVMTEIRSVEGVSAAVSDFDVNPLQINCENGLLDLDTMELHPHHPDHMVTRITSTPYIPNPPTNTPAPSLASTPEWENRYQSTCPTWIQFLERMVPDPEVRLYLQKLAGYCLTGLTNDQSLYLLLGTGSNGKSTFVETLGEILGDYAAHISIETILDRGGNSHELAQLPGARLVTSSEIPMNQRLNESLVKTITGGERVRARALYQDSFTFLPSFKLMVSMNTLPAVSDVSDGMWRRLKPVDWIVSIPKEERVADFREKHLRPEYAGIFAWMVDGWQLFRESGLTVSAAIQDTLADYRSDSDPVADWVESCVTLTEEHLTPEDRKAMVGIYGRDSEPISAVYESYSRFCDGRGIRQKVSKINLGQYLKTRGVVSGKSVGVRVYYGLKLKDTMPEVEGFLK